ncbi:MAG: carbohydrate porin [Planctomycetaceae bacterium]
MLHFKLQYLVVAIVVFFTVHPASAQETAIGEVADVVEDGFASCVPERICCDSVFSNHCCDFWTRPTLTGNWGGLRTDLQKSGISFAGQETQFAFGVDGGINTTLPFVPAFGRGNTFKYTGRGSYDMILDLDKFGGLPHGKLLVTAEHWYGQYGNVSLNTGAFAPAVFGAALPPAPNDPGELFLTNFVVTQPLSEKLVVYAGKKVIPGAADIDKFASGNGTQQFMNQALVVNPAFLLGLPYTSFSAGAVMPQEWGRISTFVVDPQDRTQEAFTNLGDLFSKGVILGSEIRVKTRFFDKQGDQHIGALWKHVELTDLSFAEPPPGVYPEPTVPGFPTISDSYTLYYGFDQYLVEFADKPDHGFGLFARASISDGNPTPVRYFLSLGLGGDSPIGKHRGDQFGIGWYFVGASNQFGPLPQAIFGPRDGTGIEAYYKMQVNPWMDISPDVQYIHPGAGAIADDAFVYGVRVNMKL